MSSSPRVVLPGPGRKRDQILKELRKQLAVKGVQGLTMRGLAGSSRVATRTLFNLFGSKDALISESLKDMDRDVHAIITANRNTAADPLDELIGYIEVASKLIRSEPGYSNAMIYAYYSADSSLINFHRYFHDFKKDMFAEILLKMDRPGELKKWVSIELLARRLAETHIAVVAEWTRGVVRDDELVDASAFAALTILIGHVGPAYEKKVLARLSNLSRALSRKTTAKEIDPDEEAPAASKVRKVRKLGTKL